MRFLRYTVIGLFAFAAAVASAQYTVNLTFANGATRTVDTLLVQGGKVILAQENLQVPFEQIQSADFTFEEPLPADELMTLMKGSFYEEMISRIDTLLAPIKDGLALRGNLDLYIQYKMRACFWTENYREAVRLAQLLQQKDSSYASLARLYELLIRLEQNEPVDEVRTAFEAIDSPEDVSAAMTEYIQGRLAYTVREHEKALQHFSRVLVYYRRDPEWVPAATWSEASIYERVGNYEAVADIKKELKLAYSDGFWGRRADELD